MREAPQCDTGFPTCDPAQPQAGKPVPLFALPSKSPRSTSSAPVMRSNVSMVGSRSRFSTRETIVWLRPDRASTSLNESFRRSRSSRSNSINRPITASQSDTPAFYVTESVTRDVSPGTTDCNPPFRNMKVSSFQTNNTGRFLGKNVNRQGLTPCPAGSSCLIDACLGSSITQPLKWDIGYYLDWKRIFWCNLRNHADQSPI